MAHTWQKGETITAELLNDLEKRADQPGPKGEKGDPGPAGTPGAKGEPGEKGADGAGLKGSATQLQKIAEPSSANAQTIAEKVNELIQKGADRGLWNV